jgi:hypothetical protein
MASFPYLDLAIGMSFIYLLMALVCSTLNESIAGVINSRGKTLEKGIASILHDPALKTKLYEHPLIQGIQDVNKRLPSYISSNKFALALMDILTGPAAASDPEALRKGVDALENSAAKTALTAVLQNPQYKTDQERLEAWYEQSMNRVTGWYKRTSQIRVYVLAAVVTLLMNADSLKMLEKLWSNPTLSAVVVEDAKARAEKGKPDTAGQAPSTSDNEVITNGEKQLLGQITGWKGDWYCDRPQHKTAADFGLWIWYLVKERLGGWAITILAVSLGAPFWFDTLSRFVNIRNSGKPPAPAKPPDSSTSQPANNSSPTAVT